MNRNSVGIFGGSFNPVHIGHLKLAEEVQKSCAFNPLLIVPTKSPPHKPPYEIDDHHRLEMVKLAFAQIPGAQLSRIEMDSDGPSYAIRTIEHVARQFQGAEIFFILGADAFYDLPHWYAFPDVMEACSYLVVKRAGWDPTETGSEPSDEGVVCDKLEERFEKLMASGLLKPAAKIETPFDELYFTRTGGRIAVLQLDLPEVSSTEIRLRAQLGETINNLVPDTVARYLKTNGLYGSQ